MALMAAVKDGQIQQSTASSTSLKNANESKTGTSNIDSDAFLTLLVAEMQNQDPLEPTSNTEWISQYATFTQVSEIQAIGNAMNSVKADSLVGKNVIMNVTDDSGNTEEISGKVDFVTYEEGKAYLSIEGSLYSIDDLETVIGDEYVAAYDKAESFASKLALLPDTGLLNISNIEELQKIMDEYDELSDYEAGFLSADVKESVEKYKDALLLLKSKAVDADI